MAHLYIIAMISFIIKKRHHIDKDKKQDLSKGTENFQGNENFHLKSLPLDQQLHVVYNQGPDLHVSRGDLWEVKMGALMCLWLRA